LRPGKRAEQRAVWWYRLRGYRILETNTWVAGYELDIIVRRGRRLIFTTGDSISARTRDQLQVSERPVLKKPFHLEELRQILLRVAGEQTGPPQ